MFLLAAAAVFGVPLFVLSLLGSHNSVSLCVVLLNKIPFIYDFVISQM